MLTLLIKICSSVSSLKLTTKASGAQTFRSVPNIFGTCIKLEGLKPSAKLVCAMLLQQQSVHGVFYHGKLQLKGAITGLNLVFNLHQGKLR